MLIYRDNIETLDIYTYMKKIIHGSVILCLSVATYAADNKNTTTPQATVLTPVVANTIKIKTRPEIMGLWGMEIPNNRKCIEYYNFKANNQVVIKSGEEWSTGIYDYQLPQDSTVELPALIIQVKYDNNQVDCSGQKNDQSGEISQAYIQWKSPTVINFCANDKAEECFATLYRILP